jgi:subtilisin family serine protease
MKFIKISLVIVLSFFIGSVAMAGVDPYYSYQWYLKSIKAPEAWSVTKGSPSVVVAVVDTGVDIDHPDLKNNIWVNIDEVANDGKDNDGNGFVDDYYGWDFATGGSDPNPKVTDGYDSSAISHGTFIAGIISAMHDNNFGVRGVSANVKIMSLRALDSAGHGSSRPVAEAIDYAVANGAHVINLSFGGNEYSAKLRSSIINAYNKGVLVVAAGGNAADGISNVDLTNNPIYPICYDQKLSKNTILGVIATDKSKKIAPYAHYGAGCIDIAAPGDDLTSLGFFNSHYPALQTYIKQGWRGSSFSAAMVSGAAALLKSVNLSLKPKDLIEIITEESGLLIVEPKYSGKAGQGFLNIEKAVARAMSTSVVVTPTVPPADTSTSTPTSTPVQTPAPAVSTPAPTTLATVNSNSEILISTQARGSGILRFYSSQYKKTREFSVLGGDKFHGLNIQLADINFDGTKEIIAGGVRGDQPFVRVVDMNGVISSSFLVFEPNFTGGVEVAAGDVDGDGEVELVVAPQSDRDPIIRIYNLNGQKENEFYAFNTKYIHGLNIAVGDVDGDNVAEIVAAANGDILPKVKIFNGAGVLEKEIMAYAPSFLGGVNLGLADLNLDGKLDIITGAGKTGGPHVQAFDHTGARLVSFFAYASDFTEGVFVKGGDWNGDGNNDIVVAAGSPGAPHVRIFNRYGSMLGEFFPFTMDFTYGINIDLND